MTIYNSQRVNNDPEPIRVMPGLRLEYRTANCVTKIPYETEFLYEPRPEYDNNPNPLLLEIREVNEKYPGSNMETYEVNYMAMQSHRYVVEQSVPHTLHALKVLEKLVRVYGGQGDNK